MTRLCRILGLLALAAAAISAPLEHQMAGPSAVEDQLPAASLVWPALASSERGARLSVEEGETGSQPENVQVSVSTSTSVEIATVTTSVSSEMEPLPEAVDLPQEGEHQVTAAEEAPGAEVEAAQVPLETAVDEKDKQLANTADAETEEALKASAGPTSPTSTEEEATSVSSVMTEMATNVSAEEGQDSSAEQTTSAGQEAATTAVVAEDKTQDSEEEKKGAKEEVDMEEKESETAGGTSGAEGADAEGSVEGQPTDTGADVPPEEATVDVNTTKGTLIFDLGPSASDELHDLVQQTVLDALMDEGLLSAVTDADSAPVIEAEGSGIVFLDEAGSGEGEGEGEGEVESDVGQGRSSPFVSIHF